MGFISPISEEESFQTGKSSLRTHHDKKKGVITGTENRNTVTYFNRRIGPTTYMVKACFSETTNRTMQDRILHMIQNELLTESPTPTKPPATHELFGLKGAHP